MTRAIDARMLDLPIELSCQWCRVATRVVFLELVDDRLVCPACCERMEAEADEHAGERACGCSGGCSACLGVSVPW